MHEWIVIPEEWGRKAVADSRMPGMKDEPEDGGGVRSKEEGNRRGRGRTEGGR